MSEPSVEMLEGRTFDVLVVGAGANGSATAEALAIAGYAVLLVERSDFGSGTSSRSSRMLHCGFRSLEGAAGKSLWQHLTQLPDRLALLKSAREQLAARADFVGAMPHRVRPVTIVMPLFRGGVGGMQMDTAAALLALLGTGGIPLDYKRLKADNLDDLPFAEWLRPRHDLAGDAPRGAVPIVGSTELTISGRANLRGPNAVRSRSTAFAEGSELVIQAKLELVDLELGLLLSMATRRR